MKIRIKELRTAEGISQEELARRLDMSRPYLAQIENGSRNLSTKRQAEIARALGVDATEIVDFDAPDKEDEEILLKAFRRLAPEQRQAWIQLARVALGSAE